ncbi:MAG TPA: chemotaxis signal transduction protein CheV [Marinobacter sp.]|uniref:Chemotaxis signal transduction protein CheV n=1 Tax=Marinobacter antarcticus TaxID=564117 RepID=A0A831R2A6_9GAMM|nr:chemotaxis protein [Marinobacter antarcticus]HDZ39924.1 chemotaxis signal transduction protein CheV [Marinobacter sp.]HEA52803.1 chemotaxis signal transduction protein CheV [Marinobacter antarcticus]
MSSKAKQSQKLLLFTLSGTRLFGIGTLKIREILPFKPLTRLPHSHSAVVGTTSFRGSTVPVIDMARAVGYPALTPDEWKTSSILITDVQRQQTGFLVRGVQKIIEADWKKVKAPPTALGDRAFIIGLLDVEGDIIQLLDVELLLANVYPDSLDSSEVALTDVQTETLKALNILLVDDSRVARKQLCDVLDTKNIAYQVTTNGDEALQVLIKDNELGRPVDILVSDIEMPGLDGYELTFDVRDSGTLKQPYIILHTSLNSEMSLSYAKQVGADEALTKFDATELLHAMLRGANRPE